MGCTKANDFREPEPRNFKIQPVDLPWLDEDGFEIQSVTLAATDEAPARSTRPLSGQKQIAFNALAEVIEEEGVSPTKELREKYDDLPVFHQVVSEDAWRKYCYQRGIAPTPDAQKHAFSRAKNALLSMKKITTWGGFYWIAE